MRIALGIEYDGSKFCGWQVQRGVPTVQENVERALSRVANHPVRVVCAGRTDSGVHAIGQVVHFDSSVERDESSWVFGANANLPQEIAVNWARPVHPEFHARFSALKRHYRYVIYNRPVHPTFLACRVTWEYRFLDTKKMSEAAAYLVGEHDFSSYRALACQAKSPIRTLYRLDIKRRDDLIVIDVQAGGFLYHMVRNIAGVLMTIGAGEQEPVWAREILKARDRTAGGVTAAPHGLYLMQVQYADNFAIPQLPQTSAVW